MKKVGSSGSCDKKGLENIAKAVYADDLSLLLSRGQKDKVKER